MVINRVVVRIAAFVLILGGASTLSAAADIKPGDTRKDAPGFSLNDNKGNAVQLSGYRGKVVLLNFWATWCHGCQQEIPWFMEFADKYKDKDFVVVGVSMDNDGWKSVKPFMEEKKLNYPIVIGSEAIGKRYGVDNMPVSLLIDRDGRIADSHSGVVDRKGWEEEIQKLLQEQAASKR